MSRTTVFEAIRSLESLGLIARRRKESNGVVPFNAPNLYVMIYAKAMELARKG
jgi:DNA-binding FadR family transcriptional regulator